MVPAEFPNAWTEDKHFVVKENVIVGACGGTRLCWLEWDCPEDNRSVCAQRWRTAHMRPTWRSTVR